MLKDALEKSYTTLDEVGHYIQKDVPSKNGEEFNCAVMRGANRRNEFGSFLVIFIKKISYHKYCEAKSAKVYINERSSYSHMK